MNSHILEDNSVTNIFSLKGVSKIKWRRYYYIYNSGRNVSSSFQSLESGLLKDPIISTYLKLIEKGILCVWINGQYNSEDEYGGKPTKIFSKSENLINISKTTEEIDSNSNTNTKEQCKELWIFQYDSEQELNQTEIENLIELEEGEFNFETLNNLYIQDPNYEFIEYHLFIKAIYNLLERNFYKHGIFRLGDHFIFTEFPQENSIFMLSKENDTRSLLSCQITFIYTSSNLLLQPVIRQHQFLRPIELYDINYADKIIKNINNSYINNLDNNSNNINKLNSEGYNNSNQNIKHSNILILLSPHGIPAYLYSSDIQNSNDIDYILDEWSKCFGIPKEKLYFNKKHEIPLVVTVYIPDMNCYINYPTKCIYIVDSKNIYNISRKLCFNPRIYHQFIEYTWRDQSIHDDTLIFSKLNNSIKHETNDIINHVSNINSELNNNLVDVKKELDESNPNKTLNNLAKDNKDIDFFNYTTPEKKLLIELLKEEKLINEMEAEITSNNNNNGNNNNNNRNINNPNTPNTSKMNSPFSNPQQLINKNNKIQQNMISIPSKSAKIKEEKKRKMPVDNKKNKKEKKEIDEIKVEKPVTVENNPQVEDNYVMSGIFNDSNFDDFGDWGTEIEITDKDFDFFDDKPSQNKTISDMDFGMDGMLTSTVLDNSNKPSLLNNLTQNTLVDINIKEKDSFNFKNSLPSTPINQDIGTPSSINANMSINSIHNSPAPMSISPINNIIPSQNNLLSNNTITNKLMTTVPNTISSPLINSQFQDSTFSLSNNITKDNSTAMIPSNDNLLLNGINDDSKNDVSNENNHENINSDNNNNNNNTNNSNNNNNNTNSNAVNTISNSNTNSSVPTMNSNSINNNNDLTIPSEWELKSSNREYIDNLVEKYHTGKWSYEPKLKSYLISFKRKKISKKELYRFVMSKRIKYKEDIIIKDKNNDNLSKEIKEENSNQEENQEYNNKKIKIESDAEEKNIAEIKENEINDNSNNNDNESQYNTYNTENKIFIDFGSAWKILNIHKYNPINDIIEKNLACKSINQIKGEDQHDIKKLKSEEEEEKVNVLDKMAQKIFIDQYTGSLSSWNKSLENSLSTVILSEENQLYDEHIIPSLASKVLSQIQVIFEDLFGSDIDQKIGMKNIYIEGPLTIKQLYDSEHSQHAKYGKYQVKKKTKKNIDYVLEKLVTPDIIVEDNNEWIKLSSTSLRFWDKIGILPYSGKKNINWFVLCPTTKEFNGEPNNNSDLVNIVKEWFKNLSYIYESSNFGSHKPGKLNSIMNGIIPCLLNDNNNTTTIENHLYSYERAISYFASMMAENIHGIIEEGEATIMSDVDECLNNDHNYIVLYLLNPFSSSDKSFINEKEEKLINYKFCQIFVNSLLYRLALSSRLSIEKLKSKIILQIIPLDLIANNHSFDSYVVIGLKDLVFTLYSKCRKLLQKNININNTEFSIYNDLYQPPYILSQTAIPIPHFSFKPFTRKHQLKNRVNIMEPDRILHIAYVNIDRRTIACMTDQIGELFDIIVVDDTNEKLTSITPLDYEKYTKQQIRFIKIWEKAMKLILFGCNFYWRIAIIKIGHVLQQEINDWEFISSFYLEKLKHTYQQPSLKIINNLNEQLYSVSILGICKNSSFQIFKEKIKPTVNNLNPLTRRDSEKSYSSSFSLQNNTKTPTTPSSKNEMNELNDIVINLSNSYYTYIHSVQRSPSFPSNPEIIWPLLLENYNIKDNLALPLSIGWMIYTPTMESKQVGINTKNFEILLLSHQYSNILKPNKTCFPTWNPTIPTTPISIPNSPSSSTSVSISKNINGNPSTLLKSNSINLKDMNSPLSMVSSSSSLSLNTSTSVPYNVILSDIIKQYFSLSFLEMHWSNLINTANGCASDDLRLPIHVSSVNRLSKILNNFHFK